MTRKKDKSAELIAAIIVALFTALYHLLNALIKYIAQLGKPKPTDKVKVVVSYENNYKSDYDRPKEIKTPPIPPDPTCPYCKKEIPEKHIPKADKKCVNCGEVVCARLNESTNKIELLTKEEASKIDVVLNYRRGKKRILEKLERYGIVPDDFETEKAILTQKFGGEPKIGDIIWGLYNRAIVRVKGDYQLLNQLYYEMAIYLYDEGKDGFKVNQLASKFSLMQFKKDGINKVSIMTGGGCPECEKLNGKVLTVSEALQTMPIPNKDCTLQLADMQATNKNITHGFCRCMYVCEIDGL